jgi:preprotein translocase subunit SecG
MVVAYYLVSVLYVLVCLVLLLVILLQQGKGDMAAAFGGGSSQSAFGARAGATVLSKATAVLAALFMVGAMVLAIMGQRGPGSVVSGTQAPPAAPALPKPGATTTPSPAQQPAQQTSPPQTPPQQSPPAQPPK